jgi:putative membrane protein
MHDGWGWWMLFGWVWFILFWGFIVGVVVWVVNKLGRDSQPRKQTPLEIARERYARGEINAEEFERIRRDLAV